MSVVAAFEAVEESRAQILGNARAAILDGDPDMPVALLGGNDDRRLAVAHRVDEQVGHDAVEHERVGDHREVGRHVDLHSCAGRDVVRRDLREDAAAARAASG